MKNFKNASATKFKFSAPSEQPPTLSSTSRSSRQKKTITLFMNIATGEISSNSSEAKKLFAKKEPCKYSDKFFKLLRF